MYQVFMESSGGVHRVVADFDSEREAVGFCEAMDWELEDGNGFYWDLDYREN